MKTVEYILTCLAIAASLTTPTLAEPLPSIDNASSLVAVGEASSTAPLKDDANHVALAQRFVTDLVHGTVDPSILADDFARRFTSLEAQGESQQLREFGVLMWTGYEYTTHEGQLASYYYDVAFERGQLQLQLQIDAAGKIVGFTLA
jgi:hypothetical protein